MSGVRVSGRGGRWGELGESSQPSWRRRRCWCCCGALACAGVGVVVSAGVVGIAHGPDDSGAGVASGAGDGGVGVDAGVDGGLSGGESGRVGAAGPRLGVGHSAGYSTDGRWGGGGVDSGVGAGQLGERLVGVAGPGTGSRDAGASFARSCCSGRVGGEAAGDRSGGGVRFEVLSGRGSSHSASGGCRARRFGVLPAADGPGERSAERGERFCRVGAGHEGGGGPPGRLSVGDRRGAPGVVAEGRGDPRPQRRAASA